MTKRGDGEPPGHDKPAGDAAKTEAAGGGVPDA